MTPAFVCMVTLWLILKDLLRTHFNNQWLIEDSHTSTLSFRSCVDSSQRGAFRSCQRPLAACGGVAGLRLHQRAQLGSARLGSPLLPP